MSESNIQALKKEAEEQILSSDSLEQLEALRIHFMGKKGVLTTQLKEIGALPAEQRKEAGQDINQVKQFINQLLNDHKQHLQVAASLSRLENEKIDVTLPGRDQAVGSIHPVSRTMQRIQEIFISLGFDVATGPEIESDYYNFEALNIPPDHPARGMADTFYVDDDTVLRTHTSPVQIRYMQNTTPPIQVIAPGRVYRCDSDLTHTPMFHQIEGLVVDKDISFADLKGILVHFVQRFFEDDLQVRFRPSYFPFTEPSAEVDISCVLCKGSGCRVCKQTGWIEVLGCGMVHPVVLKNGGIDTEKYSGYAFGMGIERLTMLRYSINDLRLLFENDIQFLKQFGSY